VGNDARVGQFGNDAVAQVALAFARAAGEENYV
jgi:hypothetical protein